MRRMVLRKSLLDVVYFSFLSSLFLLDVYLWFMAWSSFVPFFGLISYCMALWLGGIQFLSIYSFKKI